MEETQSRDALSSVGIFSEDVVMLDSWHEVVELYRTRCAEMGLKPISSFVRLLKKDTISELILDQCYFGDRGLTAVASALRCAKVVSLSLSDCALSYEHAAILRKELMGHPYLTYLNLKRNTLGHQAAKGIIDLISKSPHLVKVEVDPETPKFQAIKQLCLANMNIHIKVTSCVSCKRQVLGQSIDNVETVLLKELGKIKSVLNTTAENLHSVWLRMWEYLKNNDYLLSVCDVDCLQDWLTSLTTFISTPPISVHPTPTCSYCMRTPETTLLPNPAPFIMKSLVPEMAKLPVPLTPSSFARLVSIIASTGSTLSLCSKSCGKALLRQGMTGGGGMLPLRKDSRDWKLHEYFGMLRTPSEDFCNSEDPVLVDQGEHDLSAALVVSRTCQHGEAEMYDPLYTFVVSRHIAKNDTANGWGVDLRSACKSIVEYGVIPAVNNPEKMSDRSQWSWAQLEKEGKGLHVIAASRRKASYFAVDPPPPGVDLFDAIRSALWGLAPAKRPVITGCKWRAAWTRQRDGIIPYHKNKGGLHQAVRIIGQKTLHDTLYLTVVPNLGYGVGDGGLFYFSREVINREFRYGTFVFRDGQGATCPDTLFSHASSSTTRIISSRSDMDALLEMLAAPSLRKCEVLREFLAPTLLEIPPEALFLFRSASSPPSQHDEEKLANVRRLYKSECTAQLVFFWEFQISTNVRQWIVHLLDLYAKVMVAKADMVQMDKKRSVIDITMRRKTVTLGGAVNFEDEGLTKLQNKPSKKKSMLHLKRDEREAAVAAQRREEEHLERAATKWRAEQQSRAATEAANAVKAEQQFQKTLSRTGFMKFNLHQITGMTTTRLLPNVSVTAAVLNTKVPRAFLHVILPGTTELSNTAYFFWGDTVATIDVCTRNVTTKLQSIKSHPKLAGFPLIYVDAVVYSSVTSYIFSGSIWLEYDLQDNRVHSGPFLISSHPKFRDLPEAYHTGVDGAVSVPNTQVVYFMKGPQCIEWDTDRKEYSSVSTVGVDGPFKLLPQELSGGVDACAFKNQSKVYLLSKEWCVLWDLDSMETSGEPFYLMDHKASLVHALPAHTTGEPTALMRQLSKHLYQGVPFEKCMPFDEMAAGAQRRSRLTLTSQIETERVLNRLQHCDIKVTNLVPLSDLRTIMCADHTFLPSGAGRMVGVVRKDNSDPCTITFQFETPQTFRYLQISALFTSLASVAVEASVNGVVWQRLITFRQKVCVADGWWAPYTPCRFWRITVNASKGSVIHRVHWFTVGDGVKSVKYGFLQAASLSLAEVSVSAPTVINPHCICPNNQMSPQTAFIAWNDSELSGWYPKHCILSLLNKSGQPSDVALFFTGTRFIAWSYSQQQPLQPTPYRMVAHHMFSALPPPFCHVGIDAVVYVSPRTDTSLVFLMCDDKYMMWHLERGTAVGVVHTMGVDGKFKGLPFNRVDTAVNLFKTDTDEVALFKDGQVLYWSLDQDLILQGPFNTGTSSGTREADVFGSLPAWAVEDKTLAIAQVPPNNDSFVVFSGSKWLYYANHKVQEGPCDVSTHKEYIKLPGVLGWHVLEKSSWVAVDLKNSPQLFVGIRVFCAVGCTKKVTFKVQWSDDNQMWDTVAKLNVSDYGSVTWLLSATKNQCHRFWRILLWPFAAAKITKIEWLPLPTRPVHVLPVSTEATGEISGDLELLFAPSSVGSSVETFFEPGDSVTFDLGVPLVGMIRLLCGSEDCEWQVSCSKDGIAWKTLPSIMCVDGSGEASWNPFENWRFWRLVLVKGHCALTEIIPYSYGGPLALLGRDSQQTSQNALLQLDSDKDNYVVELQGNQAMVHYDFRDPQTFIRCIIHTTQNRVLKGSWIIECSSDALCWSVLNEVTPTGVVAEITWPGRVPARHWRIRASCGAFVSHVQFFEAHTSLGTETQLTKDDFTVQAPVKNADQKSLFSETSDAVYTVLQPNGAITFTATNHRLFPLSSLILKTKRDEVVEADIRIDVLDHGQWKLVCQHKHSSDVSRIDWGYVGAFSDWRVQLVQGAQLSIVSVIWMPAGFTNLASSVPESATCSDEGLMEEAMQLLRGGIGQLELKKGDWIVANYEMPQHFTKLTAQSTGLLSVHIADVESEWRTLATGQNFLAWEWTQAHSSWRIQAEEACILNALTMHSVGIMRSLPSVELPHYYSFCKEDELESFSCVCTEAEGAPLYNEARDISRKVAKYLKDKKGIIRVSGVELQALVGAIPGQRFEDIQKHVAGVHLKDFKLSKPFDADVNPTRVPRLDYRGTLASDFKGFRSGATLVLMWLPVMVPMLLLDTELDWVPMATIPNAPSLLYLVPPNKSRCLLAVPTATFPVTENIPLISPAQNFSFGNSYTMLLKSGVNIVAEIMPPKNMQTVMLHVLKLLLPDEPVTGVYYCETFESDTMTLDITVGSFPMDSIRAVTEVVHITVVGGSQMESLNLSTVVEWGGLRFDVRGELLPPDEELRLTGKLVSGEWREPHGISNAVFTDLLLDIAFTPPSDSPTTLGVSSAAIVGTLLFDSGLDARCKVDIGSHSQTLTAYSPLVPARRVPSLSLLPFDKEWQWVPEVSLEDALLTVTEGENRKHSVTGMLKILGGSGECRVQGTENGVMLRALLPQLRVGLMLLEKLEPSSGVTVDVLLCPDPYIKATGCVSIVGVDKAATTVTVTKDGWQFGIEGNVGECEYLSVAIHATSVGTDFTHDDFRVEGKLEKRKVEKVLRDLLLQVPLIQGIVSVGLLFTVRLDGLDLQPFYLSRSMLCIRFVGVIMGSDFDLFGILDPEAAQDFLPSMASKIVEQSWGPLLKLYQDFAQPLQSELTFTSPNQPVLSFTDHTPSAPLVSASDW